ncbi:hypothetical protein RRG08_012928 [Elysia crispata]|uniref:Uncharacterized protein n=1 Tax=Elysia crispata TaxID=231223 RepID=A0AAE0ZZV5_9GAST|nr:hypothetical protein RRG08_012928 [Elysia crispata]
MRHTREFVINRHCASAEAISTVCADSRSAQSGGLGWLIYLSACSSPGTVVVDSACSVGLSGKSGNCRKVNKWQMSDTAQVGCFGACRLRRMWPAVFSSRLTITLQRPFV